MNKIAIGTANFGQKYGISNKYGELSSQAINEIMNTASNKGCDFIDTAFLYGGAEEKLGKIDPNVIRKFNIISKYPGNDFGSIKEAFDVSIKRLNQNVIYGYIYHSFASFIKNPSSFDDLLDLKRDGRTKKIGFSIYRPAELEEIFRQDIQFDLLQIPYNLIDRRFEQYFTDLRERQIEVHTRSTFLQGLFFQDPASMTSQFNEVKDIILNLQLLTKSKEIPLASVLLNFVYRNDSIDRIILGIDSAAQLNELFRNIKANYNFCDLSSESLKCDNENILLPFNWKLND